MVVRSAQSGTLFVALIVLALTACADSTVSAPVSPPAPESASDATIAAESVPRTTTPPVDAAPSVQCSATAEAWDVDGHEVLVRTPDATSLVPVVMALHGFKGTPAGLEYYSELTSAAVAGDAVFAYLAGGTALDLGFGWNSGSTRFATTEGDDVAYIAAVLDRLSTLPCVDTSDVTLVGESNGGGMAIRAACDPRLSARINLLGLVNAAVDAGVLATCAGVDPPVSILATAGLADRTVPVDGTREPFLAASDWFPRLATTLSGCGPAEVTEESISPTVVALSPAGCRVCASMLEVSDGGHTWPGSFAGTNDEAVGTLEYTAMLLTDQTRATCR